MQFALLIYEDESVYEGGVEGAAWKAILDAHTTLGAAMSAAGVIRGGAGLLPTHTATSVQVGAGRATLHDGPFAETREQLGGFYLIEVDTIEAAVEWARRIPVGRAGTIEVRPTLPPM